MYSKSKINAEISLKSEIVNNLNRNSEKDQRTQFKIFVVTSDLYKKIKKAQPPLSLHGQLLWREFFYCAATKNGKFDRMEGNPICVQIPWDKNPEALAKWANVRKFVFE